MAKRGITNETRGTARKKFQHQDVVKEFGLFIGNVDIRKEWSTFGEEGNQSQFAGEKVPRLIIEFSSLHKGIDKRYANISLMPVESTVDTIPGGSKEWAFNQVMNTIKHVLDVFVLKGDKLTTEQEELLELGYVDFDDDGNYVPVEIKDILKSWDILFDNVVKIINTAKDGKSAIANVEAWGKLIRYNKVRGEWRATARGNQEGDLVFPAFTGEGIFELVRRDKDSKQIIKPSLILDITKETILPMKLESKKPSMPPMAGGIPVGSGIIPPSTSNFEGAFDTDGGDMPF
jgi:hypothetical protein